jgi:hypothetical protein
VKGGKNITFAHNTVVGDLPSLAYALRVNREGSNPVNQNVFFYNNIWSDPTGTLGAEGSDPGRNDFSDGSPVEVNNLILDNNLYWNGGATIPAGDQVDPKIDDTRRTVANPLLNTNHAAIILPRWNGTSFAGGSATIRQEFERLVKLYGSIPPGSPAVGRADADFAPDDDILGRARSATPDLGAFEKRLSLSGDSGLTTIRLTWPDPQEAAAASLAITYTTGSTTLVDTGIPTLTRAYTLTGLSAYSLYTVTLTARSAGDAILAESDPIVLLTTDRRAYLPLTLKN